LKAFQEQQGNYKSFLSAKSDIDIFASGDNSHIVIIVIDKYSKVKYSGALSGMRLLRKNEQAKRELKV